MRSDLKNVKILAAKVVIEEQAKILREILAEQDEKLLLFYACTSNQGLDEKYASSINTKLQPSGYTPLHVAGAFQQIDQIKIFLNQPKIDPNIKDASGYTVLHLTIITGFEDIAKILISNEKVDINIQNKSGNTPLHMVCNNISAYFDRKQFDLAEKNCGLLELLLFKRGANKDLQNQDGETPDSLLSYLIAVAGGESQPDAAREISAKLLRIVHTKIDMENKQENPNALRPQVI